MARARKPRRRTASPAGDVRPVVSRRRFLEQVAVGGGGLLALSACPPSLRSKPKLKDGKSMTGAELAVLGAACDRLFPPDQDPGAVQLGVVDYIDGRLGRAGKRVQQTRHKLRVGLGLLGDWSQKRFAKGFLELTPDEKDIALASLAAEGGDEGYRFVHQLLLLTMEGVFADPTYGGNRDKGGWKIIGFDAPCPNPRCE